MVRYLPENGNVLILHIPRCGGTFIEHVLDQTGISTRGWMHDHPHWLPSKHLGVAQYDYHLLNDVQYVSCFVRHPVAYYEATWRFLKGLNRAKRRRLARLWTWHPQMYAARNWSDDFNEWALRMCVHRPSWVTRLYEFYCGPQGGEWCSWIGRVESLREDLIGLMEAVESPLTAEQIGVVRSYEKQNSSHHYPIAWDRYVLMHVEQLERLAIDRFYGPETLHARRFGLLNRKSIEQVKLKLMPRGVRQRAEDLLNRTTGVFVLSQLLIDSCEPLL